MQRFLAFILLTGFALHPAVGQDSTIVYSHPSRFILKLAPLSLLDQDATVQAGLEYRTGQRTSVQAEVGYGWKNLSLLGSDLRKFADAEVWRGRAEVRFYSGRYRTNRKQGIAIRSNFPLGNYWAVDGLFKQVNVVATTQPDRIDPITQPSYVGEQQLIRRYVIGSHVKFGRQFAFYDPHRRIFSRTLLDIYAGLGVRVFTNKGPSTITEERCGCSIGRSFTYHAVGISPSLSAGLKLGFAL